MQQNKYKFGYLSFCVSQARSTQSGGEQNGQINQYVGIDLMQFLGYDSVKAEKKEKQTPCVVLERQYARGHNF